MKEKIFELFCCVQAKEPACSCVDCEASCPAPAPQPPLPKPFVICGFDGSEFLMVLVFIAGTACFLMVLLCSRGGTGKLFQHLFLFFGLSGLFLVWFFFYLFLIKNWCLFCMLGYRGFGWFWYSCRGIKSGSWSKIGRW